LKHLIQKVLRSIGYEMHKVRRRRPRPPLDLTNFVPLGPLYGHAKWHVIKSALYDPNLLSRFASRLPLPAGFGAGIDERCIEFPWVVSHLPAGAVRLLDAGSAMNFEQVLDHPCWTGKDLHILTLEPEEYCFWKRKISYLFGDLRDIPVRSHWYDAAICVSTIEHIGMDNRWFTQGKATAENDPIAFRRVAAELRRVVRPGGTILVTVPYGRYQHLGFQQQFDAALLAKLIEAFGPASVNATYYRYSRDGWQLATPEACADAEYVDWVAEICRTGVWPDPLPVEPDRACTARAVACVELCLQPAEGDA